MSGLIKKKTTLMQPPAPVKKIQETNFAYSDSLKNQNETEIVTGETAKIEPPKPRFNIEKQHGTKSIKVPTIIHTEINLLSSFMDENKTYAILQRLIDSYVTNELTDRQQRQFDFIVKSFTEEK